MVANVEKLELNPHTVKNRYQIITHVTNWYFNFTGVSTVITLYDVLKKEIRFEGLPCILSRFSATSFNNQ